jgi:gas vesicle structural protein
VTSAIQPASGVPAAGGPTGSNLADVVETILDKGLVIDAHVGVSVVGIQLVTIDARVVIASIDTYLRFADAVNRLDLQQTQGKGLPEAIEGTKKGKALGKASEILGEIVEQTPDRRRERGWS